MISSGSLCPRTTTGALLGERTGQVGGQGVGPAAQFPVGEGTAPTDIGRVIRGRPAPVIDALDDFHARSPRNSGK